MIIFNLKEIMDDKGISINKLSTETGINRASLTALANNDSKMVQLSTIESLLDYLKIELSDLILDVSDSAQISFNFKRISNFSFISETEFKYKNSTSKEIHVLYLERISNNYYKLALDNLYNVTDILDDQLFPKEVIDYYSAIDCLDRNYVTFETKNLFANTSSEKQQSISGLIFDKCIEMIFNHLDETESYEENTFYTDDIFSLKNIFFIDNIFSSLISGVYTVSEVQRKDFNSDLPYMPVFKGPYNHLSKPLNISKKDSSMIIHVKFT